MTTTPIPETPRDEAGRKPAPNGAGGAPQLAEGIELLGEFEDSGFKEPHYVARRADGQIIQLSRLLHVVAEQADGRSDYRAMAERTSERVGRTVSADNVEFLVEKKLRPLGVLAAVDGRSPRLPKPDPLLALKFRAALVPAGVTRALTTVFRPFFLPPVVLAVLAAVVAVDVWFFFVHGAAQSTRELLYNPVLLLMVLGLVVLATALHEVGHATALRYGGGEPGVMGAGVYIVWPAFYTDVTDAYRLSRAGRLRTDLGGVYFNALFVLLIAGAYALTGFEPLLVLIPIQHFQILQQMLPFLRLDGYYVLSDLTGVPDLFTRIKPTLKSAVPGREADERVRELKRWVRVVVAGWVLALVPILLAVFGLLVFNAPRMFATAWDSFFLQLDRASDALGDGRPLGVAGSAIQVVALTLPLAGMTYSFGRVGVRVARGAWSWSEGAPVRRGAVALVTVAVAATGAYVLLPNGDYRPIQPGERGTIQGGVGQFAHVASGRPGLTKARRDELDGAPAQRAQGGAGRSEQQDEDARPTTEPEDDAGTATTGTGTSTDGAATAPADEAPAETTGGGTETTSTTTTNTTATPESTATEPAATTETPTTEEPTSTTTEPADPTETPTP